MNLFFNSGGIYCLMEYIGAIREIYAEFQQPNSCITDPAYYGCSAGAGMMFVCLLVLNNFISPHILDKLFGEVVDAIDLTKMDTAPIFTALLQKLNPYVPDNITAYTNGKLYIGITGISGFQFVNQFSSRQDIYHHICVSSNIPIISSYPSTIGGVQFMDGAFSFSKTDLPANTLIFRNTSRAPLSLTVPPVWLRGALILYGTENARKNIEQYRETGLSRETLENAGTHIISPLQIQFLLWLQSRG